jgi:heme O synthase-like polyprenyltransferase
MSTFSALVIELTYDNRNYIIVYDQPKTAMVRFLYFLYKRLYSVKDGDIIICFLLVLFGAIPFMLGWVAATGDFG